MGWRRIGNISISPSGDISIDHKTRDCLCNSTCSGPEGYVGRTLLDVHFKEIGKSGILENIMIKSKFVGGTLKTEWVSCRYYNSGRCKIDCKSYECKYKD